MPLLNCIFCSISEANTLSKLQPPTYSAGSLPESFGFESVFVVARTFRLNIRSSRLGTCKGTGSLLLVRFSKRISQPPTTGSLVVKSQKALRTDDATTNTIIVPRSHSILALLDKRAQRAMLLRAATWTGCSCLCSWGWIVAE